MRKTTVILQALRSLCGHIDEFNISIQTPFNMLSQSTGLFWLRSTDDIIFRENQNCFREQVTRLQLLTISKNIYFDPQKLLLWLIVFSQKRDMGSGRKTKFDFETTLFLHDDGVGRKNISYSAPEYIFSISSL